MKIKLLKKIRKRLNIKLVKTGWVIYTKDFMRHFEVDRAYASNSWTAAIIKFSDILCLSYNSLRKFSKYRLQRDNYRKWKSLHGFN